MIIPGDFPDLAELKRLADSCPPAGNHHFESDEWRAVKAFRDEVVRLFGCDVGMAKALIAENEALRIDADRYQWLRSRDSAEDPEISVTRWTQLTPDRAMGEAPRLEVLDAAIDAAMGSGEQP